MESAACRVIYVSVVLDVFIQVYMFECGSYAAHTGPDSAHRPAQPLATACRAHEPSLLDSRRTRSPQQSGEACGCHMHPVPVAHLSMDTGSPVGSVGSGNSCKLHGSFLSDTHRYVSAATSVASSKRGYH